MVEPSAWQTGTFGLYFGKCLLHPDRTWSVTPEEAWQEQAKLREAVYTLQTAFIESINSDEPLTDQLPFWAGNLPYYQRIGANVLARSLKISLELKVGHKNLIKITGKTLITQLTSTQNLFIGTT